MVRDVLEAYGHEVRIVDNGAAAVAAVREREPDLLVLDRQMPVMDGLEACRTVTGHPIPAVVSPRRPGDPAVLIASSEKIKSALGWKPERDLRSMVADAWAFVQR